ncbi:MAG TPA: GNAT family N-acetyltransferase [Micromonosporaceae bacterium]|nr:GNAT family N-acetyltransferase [Micromonosporaceae bacterium]
MDTTWDGLPIAPDWPRGATVVVRRADGAVLLLHRAHHGADYAGPWGWTAPSGSRQPGEAILPGAIRELAEEAGLHGINLEPVDLTGSWALFVASAPLDAPVALGDVEHDRFEWVRPGDAYDRVKPRFTADGLRRALAVLSSRISFAALERADLADVVTWQNASHVRPWWPDAVEGLAAAEAKYGPRIDGASPTTVDVISLADRSIGFIECTPLAADEEYHDVAQWATDGGADAVSIDYAIGDASVVGHGVGTRVIWHYIREVVLARYPGTRYLVADPSVANVASIRACEKAGFRRAHDFESEPDGGRFALCVFDRARVLGDLA